MTAVGFQILATLLLLGLLASAGLVVWARGVVNAVVVVAVPLVMLISLAKIRGLLDDPSEAE